MSVCPQGAGNPSHGVPCTGVTGGAPLGALEGMAHVGYQIIRAFPSALSLQQSGSALICLPTDVLGFHACPEPWVLRGPFPALLAGHIFNNLVSVHCLCPAHSPCSCLAGWPGLDTLKCHRWAVSILFRVPHETY